jgi:hemolysin III
MTFSKKYLHYKNEELWNTLTHGIGTLLAIAALVLMLVYSTIYGGTLEIICSLVFGLSLTFQYAASTFYHAATNARKKFYLKKVDHLCIYLLIAGTYTPVLLIGLQGAWGWSMFACIWALVILGFAFKFSPFRRSKKISLSLYALMGWLIVIAIKPMISTLSSEALMYIALGGLAYTIGIVFYAYKQIPYNHAIWHLFVLAGSILHFLGIFWYVLP